LAVPGLGPCAPSRLCTAGRREEVRPLGAPRWPRLVELTAAKAADVSAFGTNQAEQHPELLDFFDVQPQALPALVVLDKAANRRYPLHAPLTDDTVVEGHVRDVLAGE
jgi:hypothetical protein